MNKKIFVGSVIAVVILILVSFTGVVGYQTTKSSTIASASPLFSVRSTRAIDEGSKDIDCDYVGKGEEITIPLPTRESRNVFINKLLDIISKMDEKELNMFKESVISQIIRFKSIEGNNVDNLEEIINKLKTNQTEFINNAIGREDNNSLYTKKPNTVDSCCTYMDCPFTAGMAPFGPFYCWFFAIFIAIWFPIAFILIIISALLAPILPGKQTFMFICDTYILCGTWNC
ncbi:MAG: hypothetical protein JSW06_00825 [Thermoplasmatales archaeon]|nr:MAG: hypothetical protein JSW06_00825 [Thermoplasmatales archaeon]